MASTSLPLSLTFNGGQLSSSSSSYSLLHSSSTSLSPSIIRWGMQNSQDPILTHLVTRRSNSSTTFRVLVNANVSPGRGNYKGAKSEIIMVDPLEAKRLAAKQMQEIEAEEKLARKRRIEAINGAWAMLGLTAGLVIEGRTGDSILAQLTGYWNAITGYLAPLFPAEFLEFLNQWQKLHLPWNITL